MLILNPGNSATMTLTDYDSVTVQTRGVVTIEAISGLGVAAGVIAQVSGSRTFGPYSAGQIKLTASVADVLYDVQDGANDGTKPYNPAAVAITGGMIKGKDVSTLLTRAIQTQVLTSAYSGAPTITDEATGTSTITSAVRVTKDDPCFTYIGPDLGVWVSNSAYVAVSNTASLSNFMAVTFCTDAPVLELYMNRFNSKFMIEVDGNPAIASQISLDAAGSPDLIKVDFAGIRQARTIRVSGFNMPFGGLYIGPNDSVWPANDRRKLIAVIGDSYTQSTGANAQMLTWAGTMARLMNYQYWLEGIGGTGYNSTGSNSLASRAAIRTSTLQRRIAGINTVIQPDILAWALGYNDGASGSPAAGTVESNFDAGYAAFNKKPDIIIGPWTPLGAQTGLDAVRTSLQGKAAQYGLFYDDIRNYVNSVNKTVLTGGDNVHPVQVGHDFLGFRIAQDLLAAGY